MAGNPGRPYPAGPRAARDRLRVRLYYYRRHDGRAGAGRFADAGVYAGNRLYAVLPALHHGL